MTCTRIRHMLSAYHDDGLSLEDRARVRRHVAACASCRETLQAYDGLYAALRSTPVAVPLDLRRNVYTRIAEMESRRPVGLPLAGSMVLGSLRAAGGTAGVVAVLAALVAAAVRFGAIQPSTVPVASPAEQRVEAAHALTAVSAAVGAAGVSQAALRLPQPVQTAVAPLRKLAAGGAVWQLGKPHVQASHVIVDARLVRLTSQGQPAESFPARFSIAMASATAVVNAVMPGTPSPIPTIPPGDGVVYLHLDDACVFIPNCGNSKAEVAYHGFGPAQQRQILVTPVAAPSQIFTGLNASLDGYRVAYSALSQHGADSGIFGLDTAAPAPRQLFALPDIQPLARVGAHRYVKQVYPATRGRLFFAVVNGASASIAMTTTWSYTTVKHIGQPTLDYAMSPDLRRLAWTTRPRRDFFGALQIADLNGGAAPRTIAALGSRPVWSPDGQHALFLTKASADARPELTLWSATPGLTQALVAPPAGAGFISTYAWAPDGRFFVYVVTTLGPSGTSAVRFGDSVTGFTWPAFQDHYVGALAWVHGQAINTLSANPPAAPTASPSTKMSLGQPGAAGLAASGGSTDLPAVVDSTASPSDVLRSYYNAIDRGEYKRAYVYLAANDGRSPAAFSRGYKDTQSVDLVQVQPAPYQTAGNGHDTTCVGVALVARHWNGMTVRYGGWYLLQSAPGRNPRVRGWRIAVHGSHIVANGHATVPAQAVCRPASGAASTAGSPAAA